MQSRRRFSSEFKSRLVLDILTDILADAYDLSRDQYEDVLSSFKHKCYPKAPLLCLAMFDEIKQIGLEAFTKKHDPYWAILLNENLTLARDRFADAEIRSRRFKPRSLRRIDCA